MRLSFFVVRSFCVSFCYFCAVKIDCRVSVLMKNLEMRFAVNPSRYMSNLVVMMTVMSSFNGISDD